MIVSTVRIVGAGLNIATQLITPVNANLLKWALILDSVGLTPLLYTTLAFLGIAYVLLILGRFLAIMMLTPLLIDLCQYSGEIYLANNPSAAQQYKILHFLMVGALALIIVGGEMASNPSRAGLAGAMRDVGAVAFLALYAAIVYYHVLFWRLRDQLSPYAGMVSLCHVCVTYSTNDLYRSYSFSRACLLPYPFFFYVCYIQSSDRSQEHRGLPEAPACTFYPLSTPRQAPWS